MMKYELKALLIESALFQPHEVIQIMRTVGRYTMGNAIIACEILSIELKGSDIDILISLVAKEALTRIIVEMKEGL